MSERSAYLLCLALLAGLIFFLPARWTSGSRLSLLAALRPVTEAVGGHGLQDKEAASEAEVDRLRHERDQAYIRIADLTTQLIELKQQLAEKKELGTLPDVGSMLLADVLLSRDASPLRRSLLIGRGAAQGLEKDLPVVIGGRVVGRLVEVGQDTSRVLLITDPAFAAAAIAVPPEAPKDGPAAREEGILRGTSEEEVTLTLTRLSRGAGIQPGWLVITSADARSLWPAGLLLGTVKSVSADYGRYLRIEVTPAIDPSSVDHVTVLRPK